GIFPPVDICGRPTDDLIRYLDVGAGADEKNGKDGEDDARSPKVETFKETDHDDTPVS
ncbi:MAG: hypothetical protein JRC86_05610, partial [Deltaproteobacteria bacterium]|nr:hypothetical protein [Deltaproteobacteria bacterium]